MASTKRSALAPGCTVDTTALQQFQASSIEPQAPSASSREQQASSPEQQASSRKPRAASSST